MILEKEKDQCLNLNLIIAKYTAANNGHLYLAFMDLSAAFDCVAQSRLWQIMEAMGIDIQIINIICDLYSGATACVRFGKGGECTRHFNITRGVRQGCVLAPFLFALYKNGVESALLGSTPDVPHIKSIQVPILLYADDAVILARTSIALCRLINGIYEFYE